MTEWWHYNLALIALGVLAHLVVHIVRAVRAR